MRPENADLLFAICLVGLFVAIAFFVAWVVIVLMTPDWRFALSVILGSSVAAWMFGGKR